MRRYPVAGTVDMAEWLSMPDKPQRAVNRNPLVLLFLEGLQEHASKLVQRGDEEGMMAPVEAPSYSFTRPSAINGSNVRMLYGDADGFSFVSPDANAPMHAPILREACSVNQRLTVRDVADTRTVTSLREFLERCYHYEYMIAEGPHPAESYYVSALLGCSRLTSPTSYVLVRLLAQGPWQRYAGRAMLRV